MTDVLSAVIYQAKWREVTAVYLGFGAADAKQPKEPSRFQMWSIRELPA